MIAVSMDSLWTPDYNLMVGDPEFRIQICTNIREIWIFCVSMDFLWCPEASLIDGNPNPGKNPDLRKNLRLKIEFMKKNP